VDQRWPAGTLTTSNALVNQLQHNIIWGERSNMLSIPTDCPQRDERLGWTGDIGIFTGTATFNAQTQNFLDKFADDLVDAQRPTVPSPTSRPPCSTAPDEPVGATRRDRAVHDLAALRRCAGHRRALRRDGPVGRLPAQHIGSDLIRDQYTYGDWLNVNDTPRKT